eukprot:779044-Amphidinium_carterae.1
MGHLKLKQILPSGRHVTQSRRSLLASFEGSSQIGYSNGSALQRARIVAMKACNNVAHKLLGICSLHHPHGHNAIRDLLHTRPSSSPPFKPPDKKELNASIATSLVWT